MKLTQLYYFRVLCDCGSFTKAAEKIHISQPSLSKSIRELESEIGFSLLRRTPNGVLPTEEGAQFLEHCDHVLREMEKLNDFTNSVQKEMISLRVGIPPIFGISFIPEIEEYAREAGLALRIHWVEGASTKLYEMLKSHEIDAAVLPETLLNLEGMAQKTFRYIEEQLYASRRHPLAKLSAASVDELGQVKFAFFSEDSGQDLLLRDLFRNASFQPTRQHNSTQLSTILRMVERGDLVAIAHNNALIIYSENLDVCSIPFEPPYVLHLVLAWSAGGQKEKSIRRLADCISRDPYKNLRERVLSFLAEKGV